MRKVSFLGLIGLVSIMGVMVAQADIANAPLVDDNNRIVGMDGGNIFFNAMVPGADAVQSNANLGLPAGGGSPAGASGAVVYIDGVMSNSEGGLTVTVNADGSYSLYADEAFDGVSTVVVGAAGEGTRLLAAAATAVTLDPMELTVAPGASQLVLGTGAVAAGAAGDGVTVQANYVATGPATIAVIGFDNAAIDATLGGTVNYANQTGGNVAAGVEKSIATSFTTLSGSVIPAVQVYNGGDADVTVTFSDVVVVKAGSVVDYALEAGSVDVGDTFNPDLLQGATGSIEAIDGGVKIIGASGHANAWTQVALGAGTSVASANVAATGAEGTLVLIMTDGATEFASFVPAARLAGGVDVSIAATYSVDTTVFLLAQAAGFDADVTNIEVMNVADASAVNDLASLGL